MRLVVGTDDCGHGFAFDVSTFEKLKAYCLMCARDANRNGGGFYDDLIGRLEKAETEEDLLSRDNTDEFCDMETPVFQGRDNFTTLRDLLEK